MRHFDLDTEDVRNLIQGNFRFFNCLTCAGKGWVWVDGEAGEEVVGPDPTRDLDDYYKDECYECDGLGGKLQIGER